MTLYHLLTHTSGVGDYVDEELSDGMEQLKRLYSKYPVYLWEHLEYYLPMITTLPEKFEPGERFGYSNTGFILLGLVIEAVSGLSYQDYVTENIIKPCGMVHTGFYRMDCLPKNTAYGYMKDEEANRWYMNIFNMPIVGGSDGGIFTTADDINRLWRAVARYEILSKEMTEIFLKPHVKRKNEGERYGLGVYVKNGLTNPAYYAVGGDFGVEFFTVYFPKEGITATALANTEIELYMLLRKIFSFYYDEG